MEKREKVMDRSDLTIMEAIDFMQVSMLVGKAMYQVLGVERVNYEDLANWGLDDPEGPKMHLHFFGRCRRQIHQVRGEHLSMFPKGHPIYEGHLKSFSAYVAERLRAKVEEISHEEKYVRMAELADIG
jgi:hypothetical protein